MSDDAFLRIVEQLQEINDGFIQEDWEQELGVNNFHQPYKKKKEAWEDVEDDPRFEIDEDDLLINK